MSDSFPPNYIQDVTQGALARKSTDDALRNDDQAGFEHGLQEQRQQAAMSTLLVRMRGGDPLHETTPIGQLVDPQVEMERRFIELAQKNRALDATLETGGFGDVQQFMTEVAQQYRTQNESQLIKKPKDEQEWQQQVMQMRPVTVDPNRVAGVRQLATKLDQQMKAVDPTFSFWTHPKTKGVADWLNREAGGGQVGYFQSAPQRAQLGAIGTAGMAVAETVEGMQDFGLNLVHGGWDLADRAVQALGGDSLGPLTPTNYIVDEHGKMVANGGKVPGFMDSLNMLWAAGTGQNIEQAAAEFNRTKELEIASRNGFQTIALGASRVLGMGIGYGQAAGAVMNVGARSFTELSTKGLTYLGTLGVKGAQSARALKITRLMGAGLGASVANGVAEGVAYGRAEGYSSAFVHGMAMTPVLLGLGAMGRRTEWFLENRAKMPKKLAAQIGAALEGVGFGAMEAGTLPFMPATWDFIRNPDESTFETYAKNVVGFMLFKGLTRGQSVNPGTQAMDMAQAQVRRGTARAVFAEKAARGEVDPGEVSRVAQEAGVDVATLQRLGDLSMRAREAGTQQERSQALEERRKLEQELDVQELGGQTPGDLEAKALEPDGTAQPDLMERATRRHEVTQAEIAGKSPAELLEWGKQNFREGKALRESGVVPEAEQQRKAKREAELRASAADPLEDPRFMDLPDAVREQILAAPDVQARRDLMLEHAPERRISQMGRPEGPREVELPSSRRLSFNESGIGREDWQVRDADGKLIAGGSLTVEGNKASIWSAEVREEFRGQGIYPDVLRALQKRFPGGLDSIDQSPEAQRAWEKVQAEGATPAEIEHRAGRETPTGKRYGPQSLQVPPTRDVQGTPGVEPVRQADIYREMSGRPGRQGILVPFTGKRIGATSGDVVQVPIAGGKISRRGVLGVFKLFENLVRTREGRDLVVASHEWAHAMHRATLGRGGKRLMQLSRSQMADAIQRNPQVKAEIDIVLKDYPGSDQLPQAVRWMETWAEWHARNLLGEVGLDEKLPAISAFMRQWLAAPAQAGLRDQYGRIQSMLDRYNRQGAYARAEQAIYFASDAPSASETAHTPSPARRLATALNVGLFDDMARLKESQRRWLAATGRSPADVDIMDDPARLFDALRMTADKTAEFYVRNGVKGPGGESIRGLESIMGDVKGRERQFAVYLTAVRDAQLWKRGKKSTLTIGDRLANIRDLQRAHPEFRTLARELKRWTDGLIDYVAGSGNLDADTAQRVKDSYVLYVPFFRAIEGPAPHAQARGVAEGGSGLKRIEGSTYEIHDPLVALQDVARRMVAKAHQNIVVSALYKLAAGYEGGGLATVIPRAAVPKDHPVMQVLDAMMRDVRLPGGAQHTFESIIDALRSSGALNDQTITLFAQQTIPVGERNVIAFTPRLTPAEISRLSMDSGHRRHLSDQQGKLQWLEINDPQVYEALMGIDQMPHLPAALQPLMRILKGPRDLVRFFATGVAPGFVAANLVRDALSYSVFTREGEFRPFGGLVKIVQGAIEYHKNGEIRKLYEELGVQTSSFFTEGEKKKIVGQRDEGNIVRKSIDALQHWATRAQHFFSHPENYLRIAEFKDVYEKAKRDGADEQKARMLALEAGREITVNFARAGIFSRVLNQAIPYFNAGLQGKRKLWRQLAYGGDGRNDAARARIQRAAFLNGLATITMPSLALWLMNRDEEWYQDLPEWRKSSYWNTKIGDTIVSIPKPFEAGALFGSIPEALLERAFDENGNPISLRRAALDLLGAYTEGIGSLMPAVLKPMIEVGTNFNFFADRALTPEWVKRGAPSAEQSTFFTTETAKVISRAINGILSPIEVEHMLGGYTAGASTSVFRAFEDLAGIKDHPVALNPVGRFVRQSEHGQSRYVDQLYEMSVELDQLEGVNRLTSTERGLRRRVETAKRSISDLRNAQRAGSMERSEVEARAYELARPLVEEWNR